MSKIKEFIKKNKYVIAIYCIFMVGFIIRLLGLRQYPAGFNQDEASAGYDAYSILKWGIDRHGISLPVHFISWGSGQNVLYSYFMIPFIAVFGLNEFSVRLPMAIIGCISLVVVYNLLKKYNKKLAIIGLTFFSICPWHIMKSRWGLESNLFPDMVLWGIALIINAINNKKILIFYFGIIILSLSVYAYGTSYMFLPIFISLILFYLLKNKIISIKNAIISLILAGIIALPMMLFVIINTFDLNEVHLGWISVPRVYENRYQEVTTIFTSKFLYSIWSNLKYNAKILMYQIDSTNYNSIPFFGIIYVCSIPFTIIGIYESFKKRNIEKNILNFWFITAMLLLVICTNANINRLNIIMIPLIMYTIFGIYNIVINNKSTVIPLITLYSVLFILFEYNYISTQGKEKSTFAKELQEPLRYVAQLDVENVYITRTFPQPYIYTLFYTQANVKEFINTVEYNKEKVAFEDIKSYKNFKFYIPKDMNDKNSAYLVTTNYEYDSTKYKEKNFGRYKVLELNE